MFRPWEVSESKEQGKDCKTKDAASSNANPSSDADTDDSSDKAPRKKLLLEDVERYLRAKQDGADYRYPDYIRRPNAKANFRRQCKPYCLENGRLYYLGNVRKANKISKQGDCFDEKRLVVFSEKRRTELIKAVHDGSGQSVEATSMSAHKGRDACYAALKHRYFWPDMYIDVAIYVNNCMICRQVNPAVLKVSDTLHPVGVPKRVMAQIGIDICQMPETDGKKYIVVAVDYFSKWAEVRALGDKSAASVALFLFEDILCRHSCVETIISDQGSEFNNELVDKLCELTGVRHRVTRPYHPEANGMVERLNRTLKDLLLKSIEDDTGAWPRALPGVVFAYRVSPQRSTKFSPFFLLYQREPKLPIDVLQKDNEDDPLDKDFVADVDSETFFDLDTFKNVLRFTQPMKEAVEEAVAENIQKAQARYKDAYDRRHITGSDFKVGQKVFLVNSRRQERKGGKLSEFPRTGPYTIVHLDSRKGAQLKNQKDVILKTTFPIKRLYPLVLKQKSANQHMENKHEILSCHGEADTITSDHKKRQTEESAEDTSKTLSPKDGSKDSQEKRGSQSTETTKDSESVATAVGRAFTLTHEDMSILRNPTAEANDQIINCYLSMVCEKYTNETQSVHFLNTFFYPRFLQDNDAVAGWTKKVDIFDCFLLLIPIHLKKKNHWALIAVFPVEHRIQYFDSLHCDKDQNRLMADICLYLDQEHLRRKGTPLDTSLWCKEEVSCAKQVNGHDCGFYLSCFARFLADRKPCSDIRPQAISNLRRQMICEIEAGHLLPEDFLIEEYVVSELHAPLVKLYNLPNKVTVSLTPNGIANLGNTCFVSACIQLLFHCSYLTSFLRKHKRCPNECSCVTCALVETLHDYETGLTVKPHSLIKTIRYVLKDHVQYRQEDAHEYMVLLLARLRSEYLEADPLNMRLDARSRETTPVDENFGGYLKNETTCEQCQMVQINYQALYGITLDLRGRSTTTLVELLDDFTAKSEVEGYHCKNCDKNVKAATRTTLEKTPKFLVFILKRFDQDGAKVCTALTTPPTIDLTPYCSASDVVRKKLNYNLRGSLVHIGDTVDSGHYEAYAQKTKAFYHYNDDKVLRVPKDIVLTQQAYLLAYA